MCSGFKKATGRRNRVRNAAGYGLVLPGYAFRRRRERRKRNPETNAEKPAPPISDGAGHIKTSMKF